MTCTPRIRVADAKEQRTDPIRKEDIVFIKNHRILPHSSSNLQDADSVSINFNIQKNEVRDDTVTQSKTGDARHCPVKAAARIIRRMQADGLGEKDFIYTYKNSKGARRHLGSAYALKQLRKFIASIDHAGYGLDPEDIGLHSIRASSAMGMYLNQVPVYTIMLVGRWSSDAFLRYIRKQVEQFSAGVSKAMIQNPVYHHVPSSRDDPRTPRNPLSSVPSGFRSLVSQTLSAANQTVFSVWE